MISLLSPYLLSSQGDRVSLAFGVEGRYPFLDWRLERFAAQLPETLKLRGLRDKQVLRDWAKRSLPPAITARPKQPYRAPDSAPFQSPRGSAMLNDLLGSSGLREGGYFDPVIVGGLIRRTLAGRPLGTREEQALVAMVTTQLWHNAFLGAQSQVTPLDLSRADINWRDLAAA
jgi:asparagine synthase (glutamine-hydrolysing)